MKRFVFFLICISVILSFSISSSADSLLQNSIAHAASEPAIDAAAVPDRIYGETVVMYVNSPMLDDVPLEDLSDFSGLFYSVWRDGKLYFYFNLKNFSNEDKFELYFDLDDSNVIDEGAKVFSVLYEIENGDIKAAFTGEPSDSVNIDSFNENITTVLTVSGNSYIVETVLDFSKLFEGFSFASGKRVGFDIVVYDNVNGGVVRYVWNDDTGTFFNDPDSLGTFVMGTASVTVPDEVEIPEEEDDNPGTDDAVMLIYAMTCLCAVVLGAVVSYRMKAKK